VLRYVDAQGKFHPAADFIGDMTFAESMSTILKAPRMTAEVIRLPAIATEGAHRRDIALQARELVMRELGWRNICLTHPQKRRINRGQKCISTLMCWRFVRVSQRPFACCKPADTPKKLVLGSMCQKHLFSALINGFKYTPGSIFRLPAAVV
jgi:hypothetical protein